MNKKFLKITSLALAAVFSFGICAFADAAEEADNNDTAVITMVPSPEFTDITADDWAYESISALCAAGIISGNENNQISPDAGVTREEIAKMMITARGFEVKEDAVIDAVDASSVASWATGFVSAAIEKGILKGFEDGTIRGDAVVTRAEMATIIVRSLNASTDSFKESSFTDIAQGEWYAQYVECAKTLGIVTGYEDGTFKGEVQVTRREAFVMVHRLVKLLEALEA